MPYIQTTTDSEHFMHVLIRNHRRYQPIVEFTDQVTQNLSQLSWAECEYLATEISRANGFAFCTGIHTGIARALAQPVEPENNSKLAVPLEFAIRLNRDAASLSAVDIESVKQAGWNDQSLEDVVGLVAIINTYNILANGLGYQGLADEIFNEMGQATVQQGGSMPIFRLFVEQADPTDTPG